MSKIIQNFYIKAPVVLLDQPFNLGVFKKDDGTYMTINEYLISLNQTVERFSTDGYFLKGFGFSFAALMEIQNMLPNAGLTLDVDFFILNENEALEELTKPIWETTK